MFVWTIFDVATVIVLLAFCCWSLFFAWPIAMRQFRCLHDGSVSETQACDAICDKCGKNLGFIGTYREKLRSSIERAE